MKGAMINCIKCQWYFSWNVQKEGFKRRFIKKLVCQEMEIKGETDLVVAI